MKKNLFVLGILLLLFLIIRFLPIRFSYNIYATGKVFSLREWTLGRTSDGRILETLKDNLLDQISEYGGREFQRGDVYDFQMAPATHEKKFLQQGEIVGHLYSNTVMVQLTRLENELKIEQASLKVISTGEKPEILQEANTNLEQAQVRLKNQKNLTDRVIRLFRDSLASRQEYDNSLNALEVCKLDVEMSKTRLMRLSTGEKVESRELVMARINSLQDQINLLKKRMDFFTVKAPFSGMIQNKKGAIGTVEILSNLLDTSTLLVIAPVQFKEMQYMKEKQMVSMALFHSAEVMTGEISNIDNVIQVVGGRQAVYVTTRVLNKEKGVLPGMLTQICIKGERITLWEYCKRIFGNIFYR